MNDIKRPSLAGNTNALKGDAPADSFLHIRVPREKKAAYVRQAQAEGKKLSEWVQEKLDSAIG